MLTRLFSNLRNRVPGFERLLRLPFQLLRISPFEGDVRPVRIPLLFGAGRPTLPFPHPWNYRRPLQILESCYWGADVEPESQRHTRYLDIPGIPPILITRDPRIIRAIATETGDRADQFDRDTLLAEGIARGTGKDMLLYANGAAWKRQRKLAAPPFGKTTLFQPAQFQEFSETFRATVRLRLEALRTRLAGREESVRIQLEPEIKAVMLEMLVRNFFGAEVSYDRIRNVYTPAMERVIDRMVSDTVIKLGGPYRKLPPLTRGIRQAREDYAHFEEITDLALASRVEGRGLWKQFKSDAPNDALRSNVHLMLAGALEATTSFASWALAHLARNQAVQERAYREVMHFEDYSPEGLEQSRYLGFVLEETLRLTPPLYFLPRRAKVDTWVETSDGRRLRVPRRAYILLDLWNANRHEDHWGVEATGFPATAFVPERWERLAEGGAATKEFLHFGFGHGPRVCPGKYLGQLETGLVVGAFLKLFRFRATEAENQAYAGISTKPADGALVELQLRPTADGDAAR